MVGAGIEGSNAARYSALLGKNTLCLEQVNAILCSCIIWLHRGLIRTTAYVLISMIHYILYQLNVLILVIYD